MVPIRYTIFQRAARASIRRESMVVSHSNNAPASDWTQAGAPQAAAAACGRPGLRYRACSGDRPRLTSGDLPQPGQATEAKGGPPLGRASFVDRALAAQIAGGSADGARETIMTKQAGFKRRVRARMAKTGESYAIARSMLLAEHPSEVADDSPRDWMPDALHISNGDATDVPGTGLAQRVVYWRDALHEGPVPDVAPAELRKIRAECLADSDGLARADVVSQFAKRDEALEVNSGGEYVLWFEADMYDQLQITEILARLASLGVPAERITLICIGEHAGIARFGGLGELTAEQLRELPHTNACARLTPAALELATRAWAAFRAPAPEGLGAIAAARLGELRFLGEAFDRLSREYPATRDGLSLTERRVLAAVADGAPDAGTAFVRAGARETRPFLGDSTCFGRMDRMAEGPHPLLRLDPPGRPVAQATGVRLTATGVRVLAGEADQIARNGIDRWIGGVHLQGHHVPWRWDDGTETIVHLPHEA